MPPATRRGATPAARPDIVINTREYDSWLAQHLSPLKADRTLKHTLMAGDPFAFFRGSFYHWCRSLRHTLPELSDAPVVLAVGDVHVENFGTWRDAEARLIWGINDFDEAHPLPYTQDLVRLATSAVLASERHDLDLSAAKSCEALLDGYTEAMTDGGEPFVLAEHNRWLRTAVSGRLREPIRFWEKMNAYPVVRRAPETVRTLLLESLPPGVGAVRWLHRQSGLGSLGRPRIMAVADWGGSCVAREAKASAPSACVWADGLPHRPRQDAVLRTTAIRILDPFLREIDGWTIRRLSPHCCRIELAQLDSPRDTTRLLRAMGKELANIHLATPTRRTDILADLAERHPKWLRRAANRMAEVTVEDAAAWKTAVG